MKTSAPFRKKVVYKPILLQEGKRSNRSPKRNNRPRWRLFQI
ncbi:hypothetical protein HMPREF0322_03466 [Desulfitobacterium hafniense DP7]|uniref:Uncharacterized protein n=1 Tax=Desulfitobacterium hafniense DP7 TaxID=537010 RepID=G9XR69_DESHA|nr:hypothetical protein HMPREF0322_03466 [Desulfitobacterium hafniense DP7]